MFIPQIPSLNDIPVDQIQPNTLVRFRGMIQNTFLAVELYAPVHESLDRNGDQVLVEIYLSVIATYT